MSNEMVPGRRYRVTKVWEGVAGSDSSIGLIGGGFLRTYVDGSHAEVTVEEIKSTYVEGRLYRDADGDVVLRADSIEFADEPWVFVSSSGRGAEGAGERWRDDLPSRPLVELELKEKQ